MLWWFCGHTGPVRCAGAGGCWIITGWKDRVRNEAIWDRVGVASIEEKLSQHRLRLFGHVQRSPTEVSVRSVVLERVDNVKRGRGRPKLTCDESVKRDLKYLNISNR